MKKMLFAMTVLMLGAACLSAESTKIAGKWQMSMETPHGPMTAALDLKQDGTKLTGTCVSDHLGTLPVNGTLEGEKISLTLEMAEGQKFTFTGAVAGNKITGTSEFGTWSAVRP